MSKCGELAWMRSLIAEPASPWDVDYQPKVEAKIQELGTKYLCHPSNFIQRKEQPKSVLHEVRLNAIKEGRI